MIKKTINPEFGKVLSDLRLTEGLSQAELAKMTGVPLGTIREYEQGRREPLFSNLKKLATVLKMDLNALPFPLIEETKKSKPKK